MWNSVIPSRPNSLPCHQPRPQSTTPGVSTNSTPKTHAATMAGFMMARSSSRSIRMNSADCSDPTATPVW